MRLRTQLLDGNCFRGHK